MLFNININKKYISICLIMMIILFGMPLFTQNLFNGQDLTFHLSRIDGIVTCLQDRQLPLALYPYKNNGYGYASPLFYCDILLIIPAILYWLGVPIVVSYKIFMFIISSFGTFLFYYMCNYINKNEKISLYSTILYTFASYRILDIYIRSALGEFLAISFLPLVILSMYQVVAEKKDSYILMALSFSLILYSHNITFVLIIIIFGIYLLFNIKTIICNLSIIKTICKAALLSVMLCSFYLFPMIEQLLSQKFVMNSTLVGMLEPGFDISRLFGDYLFQSISSTITHPLEYIFIPGLCIIVPMIVYAIVCLDRNDIFINQLFAIALLCVLFSTNLTNINQIGIFALLQFPWRVYTIVLIISPLLYAKICAKISTSSITLFKTINILLCTYILLNTSVIYTSLLKSTDTINSIENTTNIFNYQKYKPYADSLWYNVSELGGGEYLPETYGFDYEQMGTCISFPNYEPAVCEYLRNGTHITFETNYNYEERYLLPLTYYKGYDAYEILEDGSIKQIEITFDIYSKRVEILANPGLHKYEVEYNGTIVQKISVVISASGYLYIAIIFFKERKTYKK